MRQSNSTYWKPASLLTAVLLLTAVFSIPAIANDRTKAFDYLNQIRGYAGLTSFGKNAELEKAAENHAAYLSLNNIASHFEQENLEGYTGRKPDDRAVYAGYGSRAVTENFSLGKHGAIQSVDGLMSAIYHRLGFLDFTKNELGIGIVKGRTGHNYVYKMGSRQLNRFCQNSVHATAGPIYADVCRHNDKISSEKYDKTLSDIQEQNPPIVTWPPDQSEYIPVVFYEEFPDPLPDLSVSGYPVSIQLNPFYYRRVKILRFKLFDHQSGVEIRPVRLLTKKLDPNHLLTLYQFALFPLNRLEWNRWYRVEALFLANGKKLAHKWAFKTKDLSVPIFRIKGQSERLYLKRGQTYAVHLPPRKNLPVIKHLRWESTSRDNNQIIWEDRNTIRVTLSGNRCEEVRFYLDANRVFVLEVADEDNLNDLHRYPRIKISRCAFEIVNRLPGYKIQSNGDRLKVRANEEFWVEINVPGHTLTQIKGRYPEGMQVKMNQIAVNMLTLKLVGTPGQTATFFLSNSLAFKVQLH